MGIVAGWLYMAMAPCMRVALILLLVMHASTHAFMNFHEFCCMHQVDLLDETGVATKVGNYTLHLGTLNFTLENFEGTLTKYQSMVKDVA
jgi:hypothetical protein